jgi:hypothetical protein
MDENQMPIDNKADARNLVMSLLRSYERHQLNPLDLSYQELSEINYAIKLADLGKDSESLNDFSEAIEKLFSIFTPKEEE